MCCTHVKAILAHIHRKPKPVLLRGVHEVHVPEFRRKRDRVSLLQAENVSLVLLDQVTQLAERKLPFITLLTDPTMGGVSASFAFMGDLVIGEPGALIGFAGPRVIEQTVRETLPPGFQRSEFLLEKGALDLIIDRRELRDRIAELLTLLTRQASVSSVA